MGKTPFSNPKLSKKRPFPAASQPFRDVDEAHALIQPVVSDNASSISRRPRGCGSEVDLSHGGYVTLNFSSCSKSKLLELRKRFVAELEKIRRLKNQINGSDSKLISSSRFNKKEPTVTNNKSKKAAGSKLPFPGVLNDSANAQLLKNCGQILTKLMKHQQGKYIFNSPVDVVGLKLHDYYDRINHPMDLGTVKTRLGKNLYNSPHDFASDVRLTFANAMKYNPIGHEVYVVAEQLLSMFEEFYLPVKQKLGNVDLEVQEVEQDHAVEAEGSSWKHEEVETDRVRKDKDNGKQMILAGGPTQSQNANLQPPMQFPIRTPSPVRVPPMKPLKQPKPKARDPNKREMSMEEKHKLGIGLQSLPEEKMEQVISIIRKRNEHLRQEGDEIELDIEAVDTETLWELDRFVTNYKKMVSKMKRQALLGINSKGKFDASDPPPATEVTKDVQETDRMNDRMDLTTETKKARKGEAGDEDVDIGDEMPTSSFPPVEIEKDNGHASGSSSGSSSSSDDSSSYSDSDLGSSSGSDSEDAHS